MAIGTVGAMLIGSVLSVGASVRGQQQAKKQARRASDEQKKALEEQRVLDAAQKAAQLRAEEDETEYEVGDLTVGSRSSRKKTVRTAAAPVVTGLRVG